MELNASDTRSKNSLKEMIAESLNNTSIKGFCSSEEAHSVSTRHALIMDEVDGMAGSEDRGGIQVMKALYFAVILLLFNCFVFKCKELIIMLAYLWQCC